MLPAGSRLSRASRSSACKNAWRKAADENFPDAWKHSPHVVSVLVWTVRPAASASSAREAGIAAASIWPLESAVSVSTSRAAALDAESVPSGGAASLSLASTVTAPNVTCKAPGTASASPRYVSDAAIERDTPCSQP